MKPTGFKTIDEYIESFPKEIQATLRELRQAIREAAPQAKETISYQMPAFKQNGILVYFAAFKNHIGFFQQVQVLRNLRRNYLLTKQAKEPSGFPWINHSHWN